MITASIVALLMVAAVPVDGTPVLQRGAHSVYSLNVTISFLESCETIGTTTISSNAIVCPMIATFPVSTNVSGTVGWAVADLSSTAASLNVTHDLTISSGESTRPVIRNIGSFNESIDLATRLVSLFPSIMPELDQFLQTAQATSSTSLPGLNLTSSMPTLESMMPNHPMYTMWWVNGPLKLNETVPVLVLPTNVTRTSNIDLGGSIGSRDAWTLDFNFSRPMIVPVPSATLTPIPGGGMDFGFVFNYDKASDMLLGANAEVHLGFEDEIATPPSPCNPSTSMICPATTSPTMILGNFGVSIDASLKLANTTVDLSQRMTQTVPPESNGGSNNGNGSEPSSGSNGPGSVSNGNGAKGSTGQPSSATNQPGFGAQASSWPSWIYSPLLAILAAAIIASAVWISKGSSKRLRIYNQSSQISS